MDNFKRNYLRRTLSLLLAVIMIITLVPLGSFTALAAPAPDALSSATYYRKANWENKIKDKSRWPIGDNQRLVRVTTSEPLKMNDVNYDGAFIDANGRTVLRLIYRERAAATSGVWYRALFNFGDLDQYIDYDKSYVVGRDGETKYDLKPFNYRKERLLDIGLATGDRTNQRKNLPINLVLKEGLRTKDLGDRNYLVQMRITNDDNATKIYAYAPGKSSMDYSSYTKTTSVSLSDKVDSLFVKGGQQSDSENATNQEFFMSEYIANPDEYADTTNIGIIRTQYMGQRTGTADSPTVGGEPIAFVQVFDAKLVPFLKEEADGTIAYTNLLNVDRTVSKYANKVKIKKTDINYSKDGKLAYVVLAPKAFQKDGVNKVEISKHDQYTMLQGFYFTAIDYLVDKTKFADNFSGTNKLDYSMMSGWMNPNLKGWTVFEKVYDHNFKVPEGESYLIDVGTKPESNQIMIQIGDETRALYRKPQGYYNGYVTGKNGIDQIDEFAKGVYEFTLREGATIEAGQKIRILVPYVGDHPNTVNFLEASDGTEYNKGSAQLRLQKDRNINMHLYTDLPRGASFKLRYTLKGETEEKSLDFTTPKAGTFWQYTDSDKVLTGLPNRSILSSGGNFWINTKQLEPGKDIIVDAYDEKGNKIEGKTSSFRYSNIMKVSKHTDMTWVDHSDTSSILSINKSLYTPYHVLFTNDYKDGTEDFYVNPKILPASNDDFKKDTTSFVGYTKYDGGKVRTLYEEGKVGKLYAKVEAAEDEYTDKGEIKVDNSKKITIPKSDIFDAQFAEDNKEYRAYEYKVDLTKMLPYHSEDKTETKLELKKDMKFVSTASDGSSLPSDLYETRVRARVLFDTTDGAWADGTKKAVKIAPDNVKFYGEDGYAANGFEGANVEANTGDKFPEAPKLQGKNFLGWVTEAGKKALGDKAVVTADAFAKLSKDQIFTNETPVTKHLVVYAIYSTEVTVTFDANQGKFTDGKDTTNVKVDGDTVTAPAKPTRTGYEFKGWAATKDAKEADANILNNVTAAKTVYAVWEKTAEELTLNNPKKTPVADPNGLTSAEKDAVIQAIIDANSGAGLTAADIKVENDGTATVSKDGKTKEFKPEVTVEQKEVQNNFNPPKEPVLVDNKNALTNEEKAKVKQAVKDANPDRNFTDDDIKVENDGTVNINQDGKVGTIPADKTVKAKDSVLKLTDPDFTEVKDTNNLTEEEKDAVKKAVIAKNSGLTEKDITVDSKGNVTVKTSDGKTGEIPAAKTVKEKDLSKLNKPAITPVADDKLLIENEKQAVKDAIKAANKDYDLQDSEITVDDNGKATVKRGTFTKTFEPVETVKKDSKLLDVKAPKKTEVANINDLTEPEQEAVEQAIIDANPELNLTKEEVVINDDGSAVITRGDKKYALAQKDNVVEKLKYPEITEVANPAELTKNENEDVERAVRKANPNLPEGTTVSVGNDGTVTVTYPTSDGRTPATIPAKNTVVKNNTKDKTAPAAPTVEAKDDGSVTVTPPKDVDVKSMDITYTPEGEGTAPKTVTATKDDYGNWSLPADSGLKIDPASGVVTIPADKVKDETDVTAKATDEAGNISTKEGKATAKTPETGIKAPKTPVTVDNSKALTKDDKDKVKKAVEDANKDGEGKSTLPEGATIDVADDGTVIVKDKTGKEIAKIEPAKTVKQDESKLAVKAPEAVEVADPENVTEAEQGKIKKAIKDANQDLNLTDDDITVDNKGNVKVTKDGKSATFTPAQTVKKAEETGIKAPKTPVTVDNSKALTKDDKDKVKKAVEDANKDGEGKSTLPEGATIDVADDGTVTVKDKTGKEIAKIEPAKTVKQDESKLAVKAPEAVEVADPENVTEAEQGKIKKAIKDANQDLNLTDDDITVDNKGNVKVTKDGKSATFTPAQTVKKAEETGIKAPKTPVTVDNSKALTKDDKDKVKKAVEDANKDGEGRSTLPEGATIDVADDGTVTVKDKTGKEIAKIEPAKTVKQDESKLAVKAPEAVEVADPENVTEAEQGKIKKAIKDANQDLNLTDDDITVDNKGNVKVTKDGKSATFTPAQTVKKAEETGIKAPKTPVTVDNSKALTKDDKDKVKKAVEDANKDGEGKSTLPEGATIDVADDGTVIVKDKTGKEIAKIEPAKTVKQDESKLAVKAPEAVEVADPENVTEAEQGKIKKAIKDANQDLNLTDDDITVDNKGNVKVTKDGKSATFTPAQTVKKAEETGIKAPKTPVTVDNSKALTKDDKDKVKKAVEDANKDGEGKSTLPEGATIDVADDGTVTVKDKTGKEIAKIEPAKTVKQDESKLAVKAPEAVEVADPENVTEAEQGKIKKAIKDANQDLNLTDDDITVDNKGNVKVTKDGKSATFTPAQTVKKAEETGIKAPKTPVTVDNSKALTKDDKDKVKKAVEDANKDGEGKSTLPEGATIDVADDGTVTVKDKTGKEIAKIEPAKTVKQDESKLAVKAPEAVEVADPENVTEAEQGKIKKAIKDANQDLNLTDDDITVDNKGNVKVTKDGKSATFTPAQTVKKAEETGIKAPKTPVTVDNSKALTKDDKDKVKKAVEDANKDGEGKSTLPEGATIDVADDGTVIVKDKTGKEIAKIEPAKTVKQDESKLAVKAPEAVEVADPENVTEAEQGKIKKAIKDANQDLNLTDDDITVDNKGNVKVTKDGKSATFTPAQTVKKAEETGIKAPKTPVTVDNSKALTKDDKDKVKKAVEDANKDGEGKSTLPEGATIDVADDGTVTVKDKTGKEIAKIEPAKTVKQDESKLAVKAPEAVEVADPENVTEAEQGKIKKAIKDANQDLNLTDDDITVDNKGNVKVTKDGKSATFTPAQTVKKAGTPAPSYADIYYPDTTIGVGDERKIYPIGYPGYVSTLPGDIDAPIGVYVRVNHDGSIDVEVSPRYTGPSMFTITGYVDVDGKIAPISIRIRVIDDVRSDRRRQRMDKRDEMDKEDELIDTREVLTHKAYIFGYPDGTVRPNGFITRAEAAAMLSRLLNEENTSSSAKPAFIDTPSKWYNNAINAVVARGIMRGYSDGRFKPNAPITRAEFAQMISAIDAKPFGTAPFADVKGHWAELAIGKEYAAGRISGYPNGTFRPDAPITRAEAAHILNKIFERNYDLVSALQSEDKGNIKFFTDLSTSFWGYNDMVEATNTHTFRRRVKGMVQEDWSEINRISH